MSVPLGLIEDDVLLVLVGIIVLVVVTVVTPPDISLASIDDPVAVTGEPVTVVVTVVACTAFCTTDTVDEGLLVSVWTVSTLAVSDAFAAVASVDVLSSEVSVDVGSAVDEPS